MSDKEIAYISLKLHRFRERLKRERHLLGTPRYQAGAPRSPVAREMERLELAIDSLWGILEGIDRRPINETLENIEIELFLHSG